MRSDALILTGAAVAAIVFGAVVATGATGSAVVLFTLLGAALVATVGWRMRRPEDSAWLARWVLIGFAAKLLGTLARFYMVTVFYGYGDSYRYYRAGTEFALQWRQGQIPPLNEAGSLGTQVTEAITGGLFALITPDLLGGFILFAILAYLGQLMLYAAFRRHAGKGQLKPYAILIFLLPTYAFWPSSIGKDALILLGLGACAYFVARTLEAFEIRWLLGLALSLGAVGVIRIHIAGLVVAAFTATVLVAKVSSRDDPAIPVRRIVILGGGVAAALLVAAMFPDVFGVDILDSADRDAFSLDVLRRTSNRGTVAAGGPVSTPLELPGALVHVLFSPLVTEATELQHFLAATETTVLAIVFVWRLPAMIRQLGKWRSNPYLVFSTFYTLGFAIAFSVVRNLGIIARQRGQVLAFFLCFVVALGWPEGESPEEQGVTAPVREPSRV